MSIMTGVKFYKHGKPKIGEHIANEAWEEELEKLKSKLIEIFEGKLKDLIEGLLKDFVKNLLVMLCESLGLPTDGNLDFVYSEFVDLIFSAAEKQDDEEADDDDDKGLYNLVFKALDKFARGVSATASYSRDLKLFSLITIVIGVLQIIVGTVALSNQVE